MWVLDEMGKDYPHSYPQLVPLYPLDKGDEVTFDYNLSQLLALFVYKVNKSIFKLFLHSKISWHSKILHGIQKYYMTFKNITWHSKILHGIQKYHMLLHTTKVWLFFNIYSKISNDWCTRGLESLQTQVQLKRKCLAATASRTSTHSRRQYNGQQLRGRFSSFRSDIVFFRVQSSETGYKQPPHRSCIIIDFNQVNRIILQF